MKIVYIRKTAHPLPQWISGFPAPAVSVSFRTQSHGLLTFPSSIMSMLVQPGDVLELDDRCERILLNHFLERPFQPQELKKFKNFIERVSHPLWLNDKNGEIRLCVILVCGNLLMPVLADWRTLSIQPGDLVSLSLDGLEVIDFYNHTLGSIRENKTGYSSGKIRRIAHPMLTRNSFTGRQELHTMILLDNHQHFIVPATAQTMLLAPGHHVEIKRQDSGWQLKCPEINFTLNEDGNYQGSIANISLPLTVMDPDTNAPVLCRYIVTANQELLQLHADENAMFLQAGDIIRIKKHKLIQFEL